MKSKSINETRKRIEIIDILRGWALLSVVIVNFAIFYSYHKVVRIPENDLLSKITKGLVQVFFQTKGWTLLALVFGYGFSSLMQSITENGLNTVVLFTKRMFWLLIIAIVNCAFYYGDVLKDYVLVGMVMLLFYKISGNTALLFSLLLFILFPAIIPLAQSFQYNPFQDADIALYHSSKILDVLKYGLQSGLHIFFQVSKIADWNLVMLCCAFMGMYLHKVGFFENILEYKQSVKRIFWYSLIFFIFAATLNGISGTIKFSNNKDLTDYYKVELWFLLGQMVFFSSGICWVYLTGKFQKVLEAFRLVGRMTLTNYLLQNLIAMIIFSGAGLHLLYKIPYSTHVIIAIVLFVLQVGFSKWWLTKYKIGPMELIWRKWSK